MDAIRLLTQDHRTVEELFSRYEQSGDASERAQLVDKMIAELSIHAAIEERELYPVMRRVFPQEDPVLEALHEHNEAKAVLAVLAQLDAGDERFDQMVGELIQDVRHHVQEEENELFPQLRERVPGDELEELGTRLERAKSDAPRKPSSKDLEQLSQDELYEFAQKMQLEGRSNMSKHELASALAPS